jgi:hypothetical protein
MNPSILLLLAASHAKLSHAQSAPILNFTFRDTYGAWTNVGNHGKLSLTRDAAIARPNAGALKYDYRIGKGAPNLLYLPTPVGTLAKANSIKFRVHADENTLIAVILQEENGGRYVAMCNAPKDAWQPVELSVSDFGLSMDKDDPKDPDVKLDMDKVDSIAVIDLAHMFVQIADPNIKALLNFQPGEHTLYVDDFTISSDAIPGATTNAGDDVVVDSFVHPQLAWFSIGGGILARVEGAPLSATSMRMDYHQAPAKIVGVTRQLSPWVLTATKSLSFDAASTVDAKLVVQLEEYGGNKFNTTVEVPPGGISTHIRLNYADFKVADDSADKNATMDISKVKNLIFIDASGFTVTEDHPNTLWIANLRALGK